MNSSGQRLPSAMEMSVHKTQRDRQVAQMILEQRQLTAAYGLGGIPVSVLLIVLVKQFLITFNH